MHFAKDETTISKHPCAVKRQWIQAWQQGRTIDVKRTVQWPSVVADSFFFLFSSNFTIFKFCKDVRVCVLGDMYATFFARG